MLPTNTHEARGSRNLNQARTIFAHFIYASTKCYMYCRFQQRLLSVQVKYEQLIN